MSTLEHPDCAPTLTAEIAAGLGLTLAQVARRLPGRGDKGPHPSTLTRWAKRGTRTPDGRLVKLEALHLGGRLVTTMSAVQRYLAALSAPQTAAVAGPATPSRVARARQIEDAELELKRMGV